MLDDRSMMLRRMVTNTMIKAGRGHPGSALSLIEILRVLYDSILSINPKKPDDPKRDRLILSKGHGCLALYTILADKGFFPVEDLDTFCAEDSFLGGHPEHGLVPGIEASTGSLGHGLAIGVGIALGLNLRKNPARVFVILGDGEINEGAVWESAMSAAHHGLSNLTAIIDYNKFQSYGPNNDVVMLEPLADKWKSFGFAVSEVDGHDITALQNTFNNISNSNKQPSVIIAHTIKGKGIPLAENNAMWHHKNQLKPDEIKAIEEALGTEDKDNA
jgi:transketolase